MQETYESFWQNQARQYITPNGIPDPEGFNLGLTLRNLVDTNSIVEIGCGYGRLAKYFDHTRYHGVDVNPDMIYEAKRLYPSYSFNHIDYEGEIPVSLHTALLYCVCLHIPDDKIEDQLDRFAQSARDTLIIAEIMDPKFRKNRKDAPYDISNQRHWEDYDTMLGMIGFELQEKIDKPYTYYKDTNITFLKFRR